jgi:menaquinol-cytochrome c reductase iron-sulfur subunit
MSERAETTRRRVYLAAIYALWGLIAAALGLPAAVYLFLPPRARRRAEWIEAGEVAHLPTAAPEEVVFRRNRRDGWRLTSEKSSAWVVKKPDGRIVALAPQCTHLGCAYHWDERRGNFLCPCHTSTFDLEGRVLSGPAPRPLDRFEVKVENGRLLLGPLHKPEGGPA